MQVKTTDLKVGDVILFGGLEDEVLAVGEVDRDVTVVRIDVMRRAQAGTSYPFTGRTPIWAGLEAIHEVKRTEGKDGLCGLHGYDC